MPSTLTLLALTNNPSMLSGRQRGAAGRGARRDGPRPTPLGRDNTRRGFPRSARRSNRRSSALPPPPREWLSDKGSRRQWFPTAPRDCSARNQIAAGHLAAKTRSRGRGRIKIDDHQVTAPRGENRRRRQKPAAGVIGTRKPFRRSGRSHRPPTAASRSFPAVAPHCVHMQGDCYRRPGAGCPPNPENPDSGRPQRPPPPAVGPRRRARQPPTAAARPPCRSAVALGVARARAITSSLWNKFPWSVRPSAAAGRAIKTHGTVETSFEGAPARQRK